MTRLSPLQSPLRSPFTRALRGPLEQNAGDTPLSLLGAALEAAGYTGSYWYPGGDTSASLAGNLAWGSMWQDSTGATDVTALEQPVGFRADRRYLAQANYGANVWNHSLVTFAGGSSAVSSGVYRIYSAAGATSYAVLAASEFSTSKTYLVEFTIDSVTVAGGGLRVSDTLPAVQPTVGQKVILLRFSTNILFKNHTAVATDIQISGVSVREVTLPATVYGSDVVVNGEFAADTVWTKGTGWAIGSGIATHSGAPSGDLVQAGILTSGRTYEITGTTTVGAVTTILAGTASYATTAAGVFRCLLVANGTDLTIRSAVDGATVDSVVCRELKGTHLLQTTSTARGTISAAYNLIAQSANLTVTWAAANSATIDGVSAFTLANATSRLQNVPAVTTGQSYYLSASFGAADAGKVLRFGYYNGSTWLQSPDVTVPTGGGIVSYTAAAATVSNVGLYGRTSGASTAFTAFQWFDCRLSAHSTQSLPYYQRRGATTAGVWDYDTTGPMADGSTGVFPCYIRAQTDDSYATTRAMDFSGTDEMYVSAGLVKHADGAPMAVLEATSAPNTTPGGLTLLAPSSASPDTAIYSTGATTQRGVISSSHTAPKVLALNGYADIGGPNVTFSVNGVSSAANTFTQGGGNFANAKCYVYARNQASIFANISGYYELAVDGRATTASSRSALTAQLARDLMKLSY